MSPPEAAGRILLVDDSPEIHQDYRKILVAEAASERLADLESALFGTAAQTADERYQVDSAYQGAEGLEMVTAARAADRPYALAFVDMRMPPGWDGLETIEQLWQVDPELQVVLCTAYSDHSRDEIVRRVGGGHQLVILKKPFDTAEVAQLAYAMTAKWQASQQAHLKMSQLEGLVTRRTEEIAEANRQLQTRLAELEQTRAALEVSEQRYALAAAGASDGLWDWDLSTGRVYYSGRWRRIVGLGDDACESDAEAWLARVHPNDSAAVRAAIDDYLAGRTARLETEHRLRKADGAYVWVLCRGLSVCDSSGQPVRMAGSISDVSRRKETEDELRRGAYFDKLTGLPNRDLFRECLEKTIHEARRGGEQFAVLFLDFDNFKVINDSLGHLAGDELLVEIAARLSTLLKQAPLVRDHTLARLGGDEFVVLLRGGASVEGATAVASLILRALETPFRAHGAEVHSTASIGIAVDEGKYRAPDEPLRDADTAMYHAKAQGPGRFCLCDEAMRESAIARLKLENELRWAIQNGAIKVAYQPIMDLDSGEPIGVEALARWTSGAGPVSPDRFIPLAEETGLIVPLGEHVLREACRDLKALRARGEHWRNFRANVNLSGRQFAQSSLVDVVIATLHEHDLAPDALALEVTESVIMEDFDAAAATIRRLRDLGIEVFMDDFGTGYSSLSCLKLLPLTGLKLDRTFLTHLDGSATNPAIIHAIVTLANHLRLQVVAEGVETRDQLASVLALECGHAQGYLFGRPMPLAELWDWLDESQAARRAA
jgi:diguanylate cyclase (GGDEF)-like protein/PAS domain S-box-containing protein